MRLEFSRKVRKEIIDRANGKCEACGAALKVGEGEVDHILPDALQGKPVAANGRWICKPCHKAKTAADIGRIRKADRARDRHTGAVRPKGAFPKAPKPERISKGSLPPKALYAVSGDIEAGKRIIDGVRR